MADDVDKPDPSLPPQSNGTYLTRAGSGNPMFALISASANALFLAFCLKADALSSRAAGAPSIESTASAVAHVAQLRTGFRITFARRQRTIRHLDFRTPKLRTRRPGVRISPGAPFYLASRHWISSPLFRVRPSILSATGSKTHAISDAIFFSLYQASVGHLWKALVANPPVIPLAVILGRP
jgi:hypothetical protein